MHAAALLAIEPAALGGVWLKAGAGPVRERWLALLDALLPDDTPRRRIPLNIADERLLGGLDLAATLQAGQPVAQRGVLAEADGGIVTLAMAERVPAATATRIAQVLDSGEVLVARDGIDSRLPARVGVVALDESTGDDEPPATVLTERLGLFLALDGLLPSHCQAPDAAELRAWQHDIAAARVAWRQVRAGDEVLQALCGTAAALGVDSPRFGLAALHLARMAAALDGRDEVDGDDCALAARLVIAPRATRLPPQQSDEPPSEEPPEPPQDQAPPPDEPPPDDPDRIPDKPLEDAVLEAAQAAIPAGLLAMLQASLLMGRTRSGGKSGAAQTNYRRGRPTGSRRGSLRPGIRLNVIDTLRNAAPWQPLRRREREAAGQPANGRVLIRSDDFQVTRYQQRSETTTLFVVDASGSSALHRLAEAKGAVELLLADCYVRRDRVALMAFRGKACDLLLPPTRSLTRAKRALAGLPGGGGTPMATAIEAAQQLYEQLSRRGDSVVVVLLTDGRANLDREGRPGREQAQADALAAARRARLSGMASVLVDTSPQPAPQGLRLAAELGALYQPLPYAEPRTLSSRIGASVKALVAA
ncbi:MAG: magnesium chelatase subunit D [Rhodocyclaceae bacterium]|nr:magnesium chelatase subunit D [Rhodocyclaceae bacterium]